MCASMIECSSHRVGASFCYLCLIDRNKYCSAAATGIKHVSFFVVFLYFSVLDGCVCVCCCVTGRRIVHEWFIVVLVPDKRKNDRFTWLPHVRCLHFYFSEWLFIYFYFHLHTTFMSAIRSYFCGEFHTSDQFIAVNTNAKKKRHGKKNSKTELDGDDDNDSGGIGASIFFIYYYLWAQFDNNDE